MNKSGDQLQTPIDMRRPYYHMSDYSYPSPNNYPSMSYVPHPAVSDPNSVYYHQYHHQYLYSYDPSQFNGKRQRRQAAAAVVGSLWNNNNDNMGRKSTAQPRPELRVPPRGFGPIVDPNENDVLCGRGGRINSHAGNIKFRDIIHAKKKEYLAPTTKKLEKAHIAAKIVNDIRELDPPGRFLKEDRDTGLWFDIGDAKAIKKTGQALREDAPDIRPELEGDSSGDDNDETKDSPQAKKSPKADTKKSLATTKAKPDGHDAKLGNTHNDRSTTGVMPPQPQMAMPPPYNYQVNPYMQQQPQQTQAFEGRTIPIQMPHPNAVYALPNQLVAGAIPAGRRVTTASRHAIDALSHQNADHRLPEDNEAFGRQFYEPANSTLSAGGNTMSTISGISDPISSTIGNSAIMSDLGKESTMSGLSGISGLTGIGSAKYSGRSAKASGLGLSGMGRSSRQHFLDAMRNAGTNSALNSLNRSLSFDNMDMALDASALRTLTQDDDFVSDIQRAEAARNGDNIPSDRFSVASGWRPQARDSSAMSIASMSTASTTRWLASMKNTSMVVDDGRSVLSEMSADLHALDLAQP